MEQHGFTGVSDVYKFFKEVQRSTLKEALNGYVTISIPDVTVYHIGGSILFAALHIHLALSLASLVNYSNSS